MKILLTTTNADKGLILQRLIQGSIKGNYTFTTLSSYSSVPECYEQGDIETRAREKVSWYTNLLRENADIFLGADDGIEIVGYHDVSPMSGELTDEILENKFPVGTPVNIHRAIAWQKNGIIQSVVTIIPFVYGGNSRGIHREKGKYPLSDVLLPLGYKQVYSDLTPGEQQNFTAQYSQNFLKAWSINEAMVNERK